MTGRRTSRLPFDGQARCECKAMPVGHRVNDACMALLEAQEGRGTTPTEEDQMSRWRHDPCCGVSAAPQCPGCPLQDEDPLARLVTAQNAAMMLLIAAGRAEGMTDEQIVQHVTTAYPDSPWAAVSLRAALDMGLLP